MSDRACNYCKLESMKRDAKKSGKKVVTIPSEFLLGGVEVHVMKKGEKPDKKNWVCWFMAVTDLCAC